MTKRFRAHCPNCEIQTEKTHTRSIAETLCDMHNEQSPECNAEIIPVCWTCSETAEYRDQNPPYGYVCEEHRVSIDEVPLEDSEVEA